MVSFHKPTQRLVCGTLTGEIFLFDLRNFHEKKVGNLNLPISALCVTGEHVACLIRNRISIFKISHTHGIFSIFRSQSHSHTPTQEIHVQPPAAEGHPLSLAVPLDAVRILWPAEDGPLLLLEDHGAKERKFSISLQ
jgi:hypothetical protein